METHQLSALVGPIAKELVTAWGVPGFIVAAFIAGFILYTKAHAGVSEEKENTIKRQDGRIQFLVEERDNAIAEASKAREDSYKWRESYYAIKYPGSDHEDVAAQTGMDKEQE